MCKERPYIVQLRLGLFMPRLYICVQSDIFVARVLHFSAFDLFQIINLTAYRLLMSNFLYQLVLFYFVNLFDAGKC